MTESKSIISDDNVFGMFYGGFLGDALGAPHEFNKKYKYTGKLEYPIEVRTRWQGIIKSPVGSVSDDSEMTLALLASIKNGTKTKYDRDTVIKGYLAWANSGIRGMGLHTAKMFKGIKTLRGYEARRKKYFANEKETEKLQSNGCLMRSSPLALLSSFETDIDVDLTNPNTICRDAVYIQCLALYMAIRGKKREDIQGAIEKVNVAKEVKAVLDAAKSGEERDVTGKTKGWVLHAFYCSMYTLYHHTSFTKAMKDIILLGGDTDTNAAISGNLLGALLGYEVLKKEQRNNIKILLQERDDRPVEYQPCYLEKLWKKD